MEAKPDNSTEFSLSAGGPLNNIKVRMRLNPQQRKLAIAVLCITWVPLVIITAIEGSLYSGSELPFLQDVAMQARLLVALQMLLLIKTGVDTKVTAVIKYISETLLD